MPANPGEFDDLWPEEPTAVDTALTMEELILDELGRQAPVPPAPDDTEETTKKGTALR